MEDRPPFTLSDALLHHHRVMAAVAAAFVLVGVALALLLPKTYEATAVIYLDTARTATDFDAGIAAGDLLEHDFIILATSRATLLEACTKPGVTCSADDRVAPEDSIGRLVTAAVDRGTSSLAVTAKGSTPAQASALANAVAQSMIDQDAAEVARLLQPALDDLDGQLSRLSAQISSEQQALTASAPGSSAATAHAARLGELQTEYGLAFARKLDLLGRRDRLTNVASVAQPALPPDKPESPSLRLYAAAALIAGLCLGFFVALVVARFDDRIRTPGTLALAASLTQGMVVSGAKGLTGLPFPVRGAPDAHPYTAALATLLARRSAHSVMVVGASARDHSDAVATRLGAEAAQAGQQVAVLQADGEATHSSPWVRLHALQSEAPHGDLILVSVPAPEASPSALMLTQAVKGAMVVATEGETRFGEARRTVTLLRQAGVEIVAAMLLPREKRA